MNEDIVTIAGMFEIAQKVEELRGKMHSKIILYHAHAMTYDRALKSLDENASDIKITMHLNEIGERSVNITKGGIVREQAEQMFLQIYLDSIIKLRAEINKLAQEIADLTV